MTEIVDPALPASSSVAATHVMVADAVLNRCGPVGPWWMPPGYPNSLALCIIDSIQSVGVRYGNVENVIRRYRAHRGLGAANHDGAPQLVAVFNQIGVEEFTGSIGTRNLTSTRGGALKAEVIRQAAELLAREAPTTQALRERAGVALEKQWCALPGQGSGITWRYLLMLAGVPGVKPDRMVRRFVATALSRPERSFTVTELDQLVTLAAEHLGIRPTLADHLIWRTQSGRGPRRPPTPTLGDPLTRELLQNGQTGHRVNVVAAVESASTLRTPAGLEWAQLELRTEIGVIPAAASPTVWARHQSDLVGGQARIIGDLCTNKGGRPAVWIRAVAARKDQ